MKAVLIKEKSELISNPKSFVGLSGATLTASIAQSGDVMFQFFNSRNQKVYCKFDQWKEGHWLVLTGKGVWFWHDPTVSYFRNRSLEQGYIPYKTRYTEGKTIKEFVQNLSLSIHEYENLRLIKNTQIEFAPNSVTEALISVPGIDNQNQLTWNPLYGYMGNFPQTFICLVS